jgi:hypothetical protein
MRLDVERHGPGERSVALEQEELRLPAATGTGAAGVGERSEKFVPQEGIAAGEGVPLRRGDAVERVGDAQPFGHRHAAIIESAQWPTAS